MDERTISHEHNCGGPGPELRVKIERGQRGGYGWEIAVSAPGHDADALLAVIDDTDSKLRRRFGPSEEPLGPRAA